MYAPFTHPVHTRSDPRGGLPCVRSLHTPRSHPIRPSGRPALCTLPSHTPFTPDPTLGEACPVYAPFTHPVHTRSDPGRPALCTLPSHTPVTPDPTLGEACPVYAPFTHPGHTRSDPRGGLPCVRSLHTPRSHPIRPSGRPALCTLPSHTPVTPDPTLGEACPVYAPFTHPGHTRSDPRGGLPCGRAFQALMLGTAPATAPSRRSRHCRRAVRAQVCMHLHRCGRKRARCARHWRGWRVFRSRGPRPPHPQRASLVHQEVKRRTAPSTTGPRGTTLQRQALMHEHNQS